MSGTFLLCTWAGGGNAVPTLNLARRLVRGGHGVTVQGWDSMATEVSDTGAAFLPYPSVPPWPDDLVADEAWDRLTDALFGAGTRHDITEAALAVGPDVLVLDCMLRAGFEAAPDLGATTCALVHVLHGPFVSAWGAGAMGTDVAAMLGGADLVLTLAPAELDTPSVGSRHVGAIGHPEPPAPPAALTTPGDPWVLLSMSTTNQRQQTSTSDLLEALAELPVRVLCTWGSSVPAPRDLPPGVTLTGFLPHEAVLPYVDLVVSHGGLATVTSSLAFGKPLVLVPQGREQPLNAQRVADLGAGLVLEPDASPAEIRDAVASALRSPGLRAAARRFLDPDPGAKAVAALESLLPKAGGLSGESSGTDAALRLP